MECDRPGPRSTWSAAEGRTIENAPRRGASGRDVKETDLSTAIVADTAKYANAPAPADAEPVKAKRVVKARKSEMRHVSLPLHEVSPSFENDMIYRPVSGDDPEIRDLAESIRENGLLDPIKVTSDLFIISGHRRYAACKLLGMKHIETIIENYTSADPQCEKMLVEHNRQRVKSIDEILREKVVLHDPEEAYRALIAHREASAAVSGEFIDTRHRTARAKISKGKTGMLRAVQRVIEANRDYWPMTDRTIHYELLNDPPLIHDRRPERYANNPACYKNLCRLLTQARLEGTIPFSCIADPTRKTTSWAVHSDAGGFIQAQLDGFLKGYRRDYMRSQPNHIEIVGEKNTVEASIKRVASKYAIPYTLGRGYASLDPRHRMAQRFQKSGKEALIVLFLSDFDPEGEDMPESFAKSMRHDFGVDAKVRKVCLTHEQVVERNLPQTFDIKKASSRYKRHAAKYGDRAHELEALPTVERSRLLQEAIDSVIETDAFNAERDREKEDAARLATVREHIGPALMETLRNQK